MWSFTELSNYSSWQARLHALTVHTHTHIHTHIHTHTHAAGSTKWNWIINCWHQTANLFWRPDPHRLKRAQLPEIKRQEIPAAGGPARSVPKDLLEQLMAPAAGPASLPGFTWSHHTHTHTHWGRHAISCFRRKLCNIITTMTMKNSFCEIDVGTELMWLDEPLVGVCVCVLIQVQLTQWNWIQEVQSDSHIQNLNT